MFICVSKNSTNWGGAKGLEIPSSSFEGEGGNNIRIVEYTSKSNLIMYRGHILGARHPTLQRIIVTLVAASIFTIFLKRLHKTEVIHLQKQEINERSLKSPQMNYEDGGTQRHINNKEEEEKEPNITETDQEKQENAKRNLGSPHLTHEDVGNGMNNKKKEEEEDKDDNIRNSLEKGDGVNNIRNPKIGPKLGRGYPRVVLLWTYWRSGSTFLGDLLVSAVNDTFYSYEPLLPYGVKVFRSDDNDTRSKVKYLQDLFHCNVTDHALPVRRLSREKCYKRRNTFLMAKCSHLRVDCGSPEVVNDACKSANLHFAKVLRMGLVWARKLLEDPSLDLQIIYMVRDPRPVMHSRKSFGWCKKIDCGNITQVCHHLRLDLQDSQALARDYPERFKYVQYEPLSLNTEETVNEIWDFVHLKLSSESLSKLRDLTHGVGPSGAFDTSRDTVKHTFSWRDTMSFASVKTIQDACPDVLRSLGLRSFASEKDLKNMTISAWLENN
ncbi:hypothetical protein SK128_025250 [Halocaridina rubra]|uniref:Sulfotransferase domain-containing protein n=1 Tax=Halocaridina rubra TaxID=373956 RepID=A0AAN8X849_HALRR